MLELKNVTFEVPDPSNPKEKKRIIDNLSMTIENNKLTVITGPNGGGKSTLAKLIMGIEQVTSGQIFFNRKDITQMSISERAKLGISYGFQQPARFKGMKVKKTARSCSRTPPSHACLQRVFNKSWSVFSKLPNT